MPQDIDEIERRADALFQALATEDIAAPWDELAGFAPSLGEQVRYGLGAVVGRPGLDVHIRELLTMCMLAALGGCETQLAFHMGGALRAGASAEEVVEALSMVPLSAGLARGLNAVKVAGEVFKKMGIAAPVSG